MRFSVFATALIISLALDCASQQTTDQPPASSLRTDGIRLLMGILSKSNTSASLEFSGQCDNDDFPRFQFPSTLLSQPVQAIRDIFSSDPTIRVKQASGSVIRIAQTDTPTDLLNVKISRVHFGKGPGDDPLFDATEAMWAILGTAEVSQFEAGHNITRETEAIHSPHAPFTAQSPHISGNLDNTTLSEALDYLTKTFPGLWIYENCPGRARFSVFTNSLNWIRALKDVERRNKNNDRPAPQH